MQDLLLQRLVHFAFYYLLSVAIYPLYYISFGFFLNFLNALS